MASFFWFHIASDKKSVQNSPDIHSFSRHDPPTPSIFLVHLFEYVGILEDVGDTRFLHQNHALEFCCLKCQKIMVFFGVFWCFLWIFSGDQNQRSPTESVKKSWIFASMEAVSISSSDCRWALGDHRGSPDRMSDWDDGAPVRAPVQLPNTKVAEKTMVTMVTMVDITSSWGLFHGIFDQQT